MRAGYGRGYYGEGQLARDPRRRGGVWGKVALVVGVGAVIWLMWPRSPKPLTVPGRDEPKFPPSPPLEPQLSQQPLQLQQVPQLTQAPQFGQTPQLMPPQLMPPQHATQAVEPRGYPSQREYEDAVVTSARQLQATGTKVVLAPHLAHLASRLES